MIAGALIFPVFFYRAMFFYWAVLFYWVLGARALKLNRHARCNS